MSTFDEIVNRQAESDLRLTDFEPRTMLRVAEHEIRAARFPAIDFHNHLDGLDARELLRIMDECNLERILNITMLTGPAAEAEFARLRAAGGERFAQCSWLDWSDLHSPGFFDRTVERLERAVDQGACGLKIWKDCGLEIRDADGSLFRIDDERLAPVFEKAAELGVFVMFHTTDPDAFFFPIDRYNERFEELVAHPDWAFSRSPVAKDDVLAQRDRVFVRHPKTRFLCAHVAEKGEDLGRVSALLDRCPNVSIDISARAAELGRQPFTARDFFLRYQDRILFGADLTPEAATYRLYFRFLETRDEYFDYPSHPSRQGRWKIYGLGLPDEVLRKVYHDNAATYLRENR